MAEQPRSNLLMDERTYVATRVFLTAIAWLLLLTGAITSTEDLIGSLMLSGTLVATTVTLGVAIATYVRHISFARVLVWAAPADLVTLGLFVAALYRYGDPVLVLIIVFTLVYAYVLERRAALWLTAAVTLVYLGSHLAARPDLEWYEALFLGVKGIAVLFVGAMAAHSSDRQREHERLADDAIVGRERLTYELEQRIDEMQAISDINDMIHSSFEFEDAGAGIMRVLCHILRVPVATVLVMDKNRSETVFSASFGLADEPASVSGVIEGEPLGPGAAIEMAGHHLTCTSVLDHKHMIVVFCTEPAAMERIGVREMSVLQAVSSALAVAVENSQLYKLTARLAITDELTGLFNYRHLQQRLDEELERSRRYEKDFSLLMLDADEFKRFNDTQGHLAGDHALTALGRIMRSVVREVDVVARYGGEEFSVILPETDASGAFVVAEKIREAVAEYEFVDAEGAPGVHLTVSVGLASFPMHAHDKEALLRQADGALYRAKTGGKDRVCAAQAPIVEGHADEDPMVTATGDQE